MGAPYMMLFSQGQKQWTPASPIGGVTPALWMLADDVSGNDGTEVTTWTSKEGGAIAFTAAATKKPLLKKGANGINGHNVLRFDGSNDIMVNATAGGLFAHTSGTIFAVYKLNTVLKDSQAVLCSGDEASATRYCVLNGFYATGTPVINIAQVSADTADSVRGSTSIIAGAIKIAVWQSTGTAYSFRLNGNNEIETVVSGANNGDWFGDTVNRDNFTIGGAKLNSETSFLRADLAEIIIYGSALGINDISKVERFLAGRYGITLA